MIIERIDKPVKIEEKRLHLPFRVVDHCPYCLEKVTVDLSTDYLSYPVIGQPADVYFTHVCDGKDREWTAEVILEVNLLPA